jgi:hypothetical protein
MNAVEIKAPLRARGRAAVSDVRSSSIQRIAWAPVVDPSQTSKLIHSQEVELVITIEVERGGAHEGSAWGDRVDGLSLKSSMQAHPAPNEQVLRLSDPSPVDLKVISDRERSLIADGAFTLREELRA